MKRETIKKIFGVFVLFMVFYLFNLGVSYAFGDDSPIIDASLITFGITILVGLLYFAFKLLDYY
jgi:hypothetical protein